MNINSNLTDNFDSLQKELVELKKMTEDLVRANESTKEAIKEVFIESQEIRQEAFDLEKRQESTSEKIKKFSKEQREVKNRAKEIALVIVFLAGTIFFF